MNKFFKIFIKVFILFNLLIISEKSFSAQTNNHRVFFFINNLINICNKDLLILEDSITSQVIKGIVLDEEGNPLPFTAVVVEGTNIGSETKEDGSFSFNYKNNFNNNGKDIRDIKLVVSHIGYETKKIKVNPFVSDVGIIKLKRISNVLDEYVITATKELQPLKNVTLHTKLINRKKIEQINPPDLTSLLQYELPGIQFGNHHGSGLPTLTYQGVQGNYILFLVDGEKMSGEGAVDNIDFNRLDIANIERIEVVGGAMSTMYGSNALGGVINIITKDVDKPFVLDFNTRLSTLREQAYSLNFGTKLKKFSSNSYIGYRYKAPYKLEDQKEDQEIVINEDGSIDTTTIQMRAMALRGYRIWNASQKFNYKANEKLNFGLVGTFYHNQLQNYDSLSKSNKLNYDYSITANTEYKFNDKHKLDFSYSLDNYWKNVFFINTNKTRTDYSDINNTVRLNYNTKMFDNSVIIAGVEFNNEVLKHYMFADSGKHSYHNVVFYMQEERKMLENLTLLTGIRFDVHSIYKLHVTPRINLMWKLNNFTIRGGYASGFRSPTLKELYSEYDMGGLGMFIIRGNPNLKPELGHNFNLSGVYNKGIFYTSLSAFYNAFTNKIGFEWQLNPETNKEDLVYVNAETAKTTGLEYLVRLKFNFGLTTQLSYSYTYDYQYRDGKNMSMVRPHHITYFANYSKRFKNIGISTTLNGYWMCKLDTYMQSGENEYYLRKYPSRYITSLHFGLDFPIGINLSFGINNLFNYKDKHITSTQSIFPEQGRSYNISLSFKLEDLLNK